MKVEYTLTSLSKKGEQSISKPDSSLNNINQSSSFIMASRIKDSLRMLDKLKYPSISLWLNSIDNVSFKAETIKDQISTLPKLDTNDIDRLQLNNKLEIYQICIMLAHSYYFFDKKINDESINCNESDLHDVKNILEYLNIRTGLPKIRTNISDFLFHLVDHDNKIIFPNSVFNSLCEQNQVYTSHAKLEIDFDFALKNILSLENKNLSQKQIGQILDNVAIAITNMTSSLYLWKMKNNNKSVDNTLWARTVLKFSSKVFTNENGSSGEDNPFIHAFDSLLFKNMIDSKLERKNNMSTSNLDLLNRILKIDLYKLVENNNYNKEKLTLVLIYYKNFLKKHHTKAVGGIGLAQSTGRSSTNGGRKVNDTSFEKLISDALNRLNSKRFNSLSFSMPAGIKAKSVNAATVFNGDAKLVKILLDHPMNIQPGDHLEVKTNSKNRLYSILNFENKDKQTLIEVVVKASESVFLNECSNKENEFMHIVNSNYHKANDKPTLYFSQGTGISSNIFHINQNNNNSDIHFVSLKNLSDIELISERSNATTFIISSSTRQLFKLENRNLSEVNLINKPHPFRWNKVLSEIQNLMPIILDEYNIFVCGSVAFKDTIQEYAIDNSFDFDCWRESVYQSSLGSDKENIDAFEFLMSDNNLLHYEINGSVYDFSKISDSHPGGKKPIQLYSNIIGDKTFEIVHSNSDVVKGYLNEYFIGGLNNKYLKPVIGPLTLDQQKIELINVVNKFNNILSVNSSFPPGKELPEFVVNDILYSVFKIYIKDLIKSIFSKLPSNESFLSRSLSYIEELDNIFDSKIGGSSDYNHLQIIINNVLTESNKLKVNIINLSSISLTVLDDLLVDFIDCVK